MGPRVKEPKPQPAALALLLSSAPQSQHLFMGASKQANALLKAISGASAHGVTWEKETRGPPRAELEVIFRGFAKSLGRLSAPQA